MNKTKYNIVCFTDKSKSGFSIDKNDLTTAFYCLHDCINSGLYENVMFRTIKNIGCGFWVNSPVLTWENTNNILKLHDTLTARGIETEKYYILRFKRFVKERDYKLKYTIDN